MNCKGFFRFNKELRAMLKQYLNCASVLFARVYVLEKQFGARQMLDLAEGREPRLYLLKKQAHLSASAFDKACDACQSLSRVYGAQWLKAARAA